MKVGDLVTIAPAETGIYLITSLDGFWNDKALPGCVMLASLDDPSVGFPLPMQRRWIVVISES